MINQIRSSTTSFHDSAKQVEEERLPNDDVDDWKHCVWISVILRTNNSPPQMVPVVCIPIEPISK